MNSRVKGKVGEREVKNLLNEALGYEAFKRNVMQSREGGCDRVFARRARGGA